MTPRRDLLLDWARAMSLIAVVAGHWLQSGFELVRAPGGPATGPGAWEVVEANPLPALPWAAPLTWLVAVLGIFFCVGGRLSAGSWERARAAGLGWPAWAGRRLAGFARPMAAAAGVVAAVLGAAYLAGVPAPTLRLALELLARPCWFLAVYAVLTVLTPALVALNRRCGLAAPAAMVLITAGVDWWRWGPAAGSTPGWLGWINAGPGWAFAFQLGIWWAGHRAQAGAARRRGWGLAAGAAGALALLMTVGGYPATMLAGAGSDDRPSVHPPSLTLVALMTLAIGLLWMLENPTRRWLEGRRPRRAGPVGRMVRQAPITVLCAHQAAAVFWVLLAAAATPATPIPGLTAPPQNAWWLVPHAAWMLVWAATLWLIVKLAAPRRK
jgi:hypothetical protein